MNSTTLDDVLVTLDVAVDALAVCEVKRGVSLIGSPENAIIVHYVLAGTMHVAVSGIGPLVCGKGGIVVVPPGLGLSISADAVHGDPVVAADHLAIGREGLLMVDAAGGGEGDLRFACGAVSANIPALAGLFNDERTPLTEDLGDLMFVNQAFALMLDEISTFGLGARALAGSLMKACLILFIRRRLARDATGPKGLAALRHPRLGKALTAILDQPASPHTVATLAAGAGMSRSSFAKEFVHAFDMTPMAFVTKTRLHMAAGLLRSTQAPVKSIAAAVGFSSRSHFSRAFDQAYGTDPSQFRRVAEIGRAD